MESPLPGAHTCGPQRRKQGLGLWMLSVNSCFHPSAHENTSDLLEQSVVITGLYGESVPPPRAAWTPGGTGPGAPCIPDCLLSLRVCV